MAKRRQATLADGVTGHRGCDMHGPAGRNGGGPRNGKRSGASDVGPVGVAGPRDRRGGLEWQIARK
ncbi:hypothetical protein [Streptomyces sp. NPDC096152]|uniref:hypothetical protein n=1 Tax=Streptomyces sp. NPDC096152 TaxID=3366078 RepID=UPI00381E07BC